MRNVVIVSAARTPIGDFAGTLSSTPADVLGAVVLEAVVERAGVEKSVVDEVIMGNVLPHGLGQNPARQAMMKAGLPQEEAFALRNVLMETQGGPGNGQQNGGPADGQQKPAAVARA